MFSVLTGGVFLFAVVTLVKTLKARNVRPYLLPYAAVILTGFYGTVGMSDFLIPMLQTNLVEGALNGVLFISGFGVMCWGLSVFKQLQMEAA